jgi:hypothetical protein
MTSEQETKKGYNYLLLLCFLHFPLLAALSVVGACLKVFLAEVAAGLPLQLHWMFCTSLAIIVWSITALTKIMLEEEEDRAFISPVARILVYSGLGLLVVPIFKNYLSTLNFLAIVALILLLPVCIGIHSWVKFKFGAKQPG